MLPKGLFGICSNAVLQNGVAQEDVVRAFLQERLSPEEEYFYETSRDGRCIMGIIRSRLVASPGAVSRDAESDALGAFDGLLFGNRMFGLSPHRLISLPHLNPSHTNGMFSCAAYKPGRLRLLSDPFGTTPLYYRVERDIVLFSSSISLLAEFPGLPRPGRDDAGIAEFLAFGAPLDGHTLHREIHRLRNAELMEFDLFTMYAFSNRYWMPDLTPGDPARTLEWTAEAFKQATRRCLAAGAKPFTAALTGGLNSRAVWAALHALGAEASAETYAMLPGEDLRIAQRVAQRLGARHTIHWIDEEFDEGFGEYLRMLGEATNRTLPASRAHLPFVLRKQAGEGATQIEGEHSCLENRRCMRLQAGGAEGKREFFETLWTQLSADSLLEFLRPADRERYQWIARESFRTLVPDPEDWPTPGMAVDHFTLMHLGPIRMGDINGLRNHFHRSISPFFDLDYVTEAAHVPEEFRRRQAPQREIIARFAPELRRFPHSTGDELSIPFAKRYSLRDPAAWGMKIRTIFNRLLPPVLLREADEHPFSLDYTPVRPQIEALLGDGEEESIDLPVCFTGSWLRSGEPPRKQIMTILPHLLVRRYEGVRLTDSYGSEHSNSQELLRNDPIGTLRG